MPSKVGIIEKLNHISNDKVFDYFSIQANKYQDSDDPTVLFKNDNSFWYCGGLNNSKISINLNNQFGVYITHILLRSGDANFPTSWDVNSSVQNHQIVVDSHFNDDTMKVKFTPYIFQSKQKGYFNNFNIQLTAENQGGYDTFCLSYIDFFGLLTDEKGRTIISAPYYPLIPTIFHSQKVSHPFFAIFILYAI